MEEQLSADIELEPDLAPGMEPEEGAPTRRTVKRTAVQQGSEIPTGWKPTSREPIPVVRCVYIFKNGHVRQGERCEQWSLRGSQLCYAHSGRGNLKNLEAYRQSIIESARLKLTESVPDALNWLIDLAANSGADNVRLKAATEILDRAGVKTAEQLDVTVSVEESPAVALAQRLHKLKTAADIIREKETAAETAAEETAGEQLAIESAADVVVIEGEIIEDDG